MKIIKVLIWVIVALPILGLIGAFFYAAYILFGAVAKTLVVAFSTVVGLAIVAITIISVVAIRTIFGKKPLLDLNLSMRAKEKKIIEIKPQKYDYSKFKAKTANGDIELTGNSLKKVSGTVGVRCENEEEDVLVSFNDGTIAAKTKDGKDVYIENISVKLPDTLSEIGVSTASGNIAVRGFKKIKNLEAKAASGDIEISDFLEAKDVEIKNVSGQIGINKCNIDNLEATLVSGNIALNHSKVNVFSGSTVSGNIEIENSKIKERQVHTVSGKVNG